MIQRFATPRPITAREQRLIELYAYCPLAMTPEQFYAKWDIKQEAIAIICFRSVSMVRRWFAIATQPLPSPTERSSSPGINGFSARTF